VSVDQTTWCAAEAADKLLCAVQSLLPSALEDGVQSHRSALRNVTRCISNILTDSRLCHVPQCAERCASPTHGQMADTLRALLVMLEGNTPVPARLVADALADRRTPPDAPRDG
jgi:hypothetical protein